MYRCVLLVLLLCVVAPFAAAQHLPGAGDDAGKTVVYRDTWGVPHIYAPTAEAGLYAMGWTQAEDRPEQMLQNFLLGMGELSSIAGPGALREDRASRIFAHYRKAKELADDELSPDVRGHLEAFVAGIRDYFDAHPENMPAWWGDREFDIYMVIAFGRIFLYGWSIDDGFEDLERAGIEPGFDMIYRSSNQFAVAPERTAAGASILYIDPHLSWFGPSRFWECRIHAGDLHGSGFNLAGHPYIGLGHNADVGWAMTTGGPDTADIYELTLHAHDPARYFYDGAWKTFDQRVEVIEVRGEDDVELPIRASIHGPVVAMRDGKAYAIKTAYMDCVRGLEAWHHFNYAKDYTGIVKGLDTQQVFPQNIMAADTSGNIYYHRTGRVPIRPDGFDWSRPVPGNTAATQWQGLHPQSDLVHILNPETGYMQNCNIPPDAMMVDSPLQPDKYPDYIFSDLGYGPRSGWIKNRGARAVELLMADDKVTVEDAKNYGLDVSPFGAARWIAALVRADEAFGDSYASNAAYQRAIEELADWNLQLARDSRAALKYFYWREAIDAAQGGGALEDAIDQHYRIVQPDVDFTEPELSEMQRKALLAALDKAMKELAAEFSLDAVYGDKYRVGRDDQSWPVGGGSQYGTRTLRSVSYSGERDDHTRWGRAGQTSTQIVICTNPIQSWTQPPIGQSDHADSPHYDDQAEKLFSERRFKESWWLPEDLKDHIARRIVLDNAP
ncbi:MAG: penicillin acylase family protein [Candidatus Hydrogenedentota bacterium]